MTRTYLHTSSCLHYSVWKIKIIISFGQCTLESNCLFGFLPLYQLTFLPLFGVFWGPVKHLLSLLHSPGNISVLATLTSLWHTIAIFFYYLLRYGNGQFWNVGSKGHIFYLRTHMYTVLINLLVNNWWSIDVFDVPDLKRWEVTD